MNTRKRNAQDFCPPGNASPMRDQERKVYNKVKSKRPSIPRKHSIWTDIADMCLEKREKTNQNEANLYVKPVQENQSPFNKR